MSELVVNALIQCADGENAALSGIILENIQGGEEQMIVSNKPQAVPRKFRQLLRFAENEATLDFNLEEVGAPIDPPPEKPCQFKSIIVGD